jgi:tRNA(Ile)-lysidine synthase
MQNDLEKRVLEMIRTHHMIAPGDTGIVAVSGGPDSVFLLHMLDRLSQSDEFRNPKEHSEEKGFHLIAVHVNHGIRGKEADRDEEFVKNLCAELSIPCRVFHKNVPAIAEESGKTLEEAGREVRYSCFEEVKRETGASWIALAHHKGDSVETILFNLLRGTGLRGLRGILPVQQDRIRPLLNLSKEEILQWLEERRIPYCTDSTNLDSDYARNRIRNRILPEMLEVNPGAAEHIFRLSQDAEEWYNNISDEAEKLSRHCEMIPDSEGEGISEIRIPEKVWSGMTGENHELPLPEREVLGELILRELSVLSGSSKDIGRRHIDAVILLISKETGKRADLPYGLQAVRTVSGLTLRKESSPVRKPIGKLSITRRPYIPGEEIPSDTYHKMIDAESVTGTLILRTPESEDRIIIDGSDQVKKKKLTRLFTDSKIPVPERAGWPLVADEEKVLWVVGIRLSEACKVKDSTKEVYLLDYSCEAKEE